MPLCTHRGQRTVSRVGVAFLLAGDRVSCFGAYSRPVGFPTPRISQGLPTMNLIIEGLGLQTHTTTVSSLIWVWGIQTQAL